MLMNETSFETMRDIGHEFGLTSHKLGKILAEQGFRESGKPTAKAHRHDWVNQRYAPDSTNYTWAWHVGKTRALLESLGYERLVAESDAAQSVSP